MVVRKTIPKRIVSKKLVSENRFIRKKKYIDPYIKFKDKKSRKILEIT